MDIKKVIRVGLILLGIVVGGIFISSLSEIRLELLGLALLFWYVAKLNYEDIKNLQKKQGELEYKIKQLEDKTDNLHEINSRGK